MKVIVYRTEYGLKARYTSPEDNLDEMPELMYEFETVEKLLGWKENKSIGSEDITLAEIFRLVGLELEEKEPATFFQNNRSN